MEKGKLKLKIVSPCGSKEELLCDSIRLNISDNDKNQGGSYGIRFGHTKALMAVAEGEIAAFSDGERIFSLTVSSGFASVEDNQVIIAVDKFN